jgi:PBP1b-binding outer membrane lipoprotein LpoB
MLQAQGVTAGSVLLVDSVNNRTNGSLNAGEATKRCAMRWQTTVSLRWSLRSSSRLPNSNWACRTG